MSPEAGASAAFLARLLAEIAADREGLARRMADAEEARRRLDVTPSDPGALALAAVALHGWYTGLETIFERIARELDGAVPSGDRWHRELLTQMTVEVPAHRPAVIDAALLSDLGALLAFRHFFRHAYAATLDPGRVDADLARLLRAAGPTGAALDGFAGFLRAAMARLAQS